MDRLASRRRGRARPATIFTSDLSVNELALLGQAGYEPLGQVMGSSVYHVGWQYMPDSGTGSLRRAVQMRC